ncbi:MAG: histidinol phosphate phosphatase domain-containing protein, partial [Candidatus Omnitrophota bacterium]
MIDLHTHTFLSDGALIPSELVRRAQVAGLTAIAITDHIDHSNIDMVLPAIIKVSEVLNQYWDIVVIPGVEITHVPIEVFPELTLYARKMGAKIVVAHGESSVEPVLPGTNAA